MKRRIVEIAVGQHDAHASAWFQKAQAAFYKDKFGCSIPLVFGDFKEVEDTGTRRRCLPPALMGLLPGLSLTPSSAASVGWVGRNACFLATGHFPVGADVSPEGRIGDDN